jgi:uncharacterized protein (DUF58 family)
MIGALLQRVRDRRQRRHENSSEPAILCLGRIYILPTRNGVLFGLVLAAMLFGAVNYGNSLAYALMFLLTSVAIISILHTHRNLAGLVVQAGLCRPVFAGEPALFPLGLSGGNTPRFALVIQEAGASEPVITDLDVQVLQWEDIRLPATERGWLERGRVTVSSSFPLGLFRAWSYIDLPQRCLVYPSPEREGPPPFAADGEGEKQAATTQGSEDFSSLREYRPGDSLKHVHWKALAREQGLLTKAFTGSGSRNFRLDWDYLSGLGTEARLARLCRWVLWADACGQPYQLAIPGIRIPAAHGGEHRQRCLRALALFGKI